MTLRPYQDRAISALRARFREGSRRNLLILPTGGGKTVIAQEIVRSAMTRGRVLFLAHRRELVGQPFGRFTAAGIRCGVIMGDDGRVDLGAPVQIASVQTIAARGAGGLGLNWGLVVLDEAHHGVAETFKDVLKATAPAPLVGLTATPWRADGVSLTGSFDSTVVAATPAELIAGGYLCQYSGFSFESPAGATDSAEAARGRVVGGVCDRYHERTPGRKALVFAQSIAESKVIAAEFIRRGYAAEHVDGKTPEAARDAATGRFASGETQILCNVGLFGEGYDVPDAGVCILGRHTKSLSLYLQMVGRVMRSSPGKLRAEIHDHAQNIVFDDGQIHHGFPDDERDYSLEAGKDRKARAQALSTCPQCFAIYPCSPVCPACGYSSDATKRKAEQLAIKIAADERRLVELEEIKARRSAEKSVEGKQRAEWDRLVARATERGYKLGWTLHRFEEKFGTLPPRGWWNLARAAENKRRLSLPVESAAYEREPGEDG